MGLQLLRRGQFAAALFACGWFVHAGTAQPALPNPWPATPRGVDAVQPPATDRQPPGNPGSSPEAKPDDDAKKDDAKKDGDKKDNKEKPVPTWHGHTFPVQPFPPPGAAPIAPTGPGYYTALDCLQGDYRETPPRWPYARFGLKANSLFEVDFRYLDSVPFEDRDWAEKLKRIPVREHWLFSTGGDVRVRDNVEYNSRLSGRDNSYGLFRGRLFGDLWYEDRFRVYAELFYGDSVWQDLPPLPRDVNRGDIANLFVDVKVCDLGCDGNPVYVRAGRQELLYGSQRLVSPNEWGDNRVRFQGVKGFYRAPEHEFDVWWANPVQVRFDQLDPPDQHQTFAGAWYTYKPKKGTWVDAYYLLLENNLPTAARGQFRSGGFGVSTFGSRFYGRADTGLLWDVEGAVQLGRWADQTIFAQMFTASVGYYLKDCAWTPTFWVSYDYASGDPDPNNTARRQTFNQLFAFGHYYFGFADLVGRQNIRDLNVQAYAYPANWVTTGIQYHVFRLDSAKDALYNAFGQATRQDRTGRAGNDVGSEIDLLVNFHLTDRQDVFASYSRFFSGSFIQGTQPAGTRAKDVDALYVQYSWRW